MAWDGASLWYANQYNVYQLDTSGNILSQFAFPRNVMGLDWDGSNLWLANSEWPEKTSLSVVDTSGTVLRDLSHRRFLRSMPWPGEMDASGRLVKTPSVAR